MGNRALDMIERVRKLVAALVLTLFAALCVADRVCCPDGCTDEAQSAGETQHAPDGASCALCTGVICGPADETLPSLALAEVTAPLEIGPPDDANANPADYPPRS